MLLFYIYFLLLQLQLQFIDSFNKITNLFSNNNIIQWNENLCQQIFYETHLYPPNECLIYYSEKQKKQINKKGFLKKILITGTARSGTTMLAALASSLGIHLSNDAHPPTAMGTVSWSLASPPNIDPICPVNPRLNNNNNNNNNNIPNTDDESYIEESNYALARTKYRFKYIFHQVRNPLSSIPSLITEIPHWKRCQSELSQIIPEMNFDATPEHMALQIWVEWNSRLDKYPFIPVYRVEDFNLLDLLRSINHSCTMTEDDFLCAYRKFLGFNTRVSSSGRQKITWKHIYSINHTLAQRAMDMAYNYGYRYYKNSTLIKMKPSYSKEYYKHLAQNNITKQQELQQQQQQQQQQFYNNGIHRRLYTTFSTSTPSAEVKRIHVVKYSKPRPVIKLPQNNPVINYDNAEQILQQSKEQQKRQQLNDRYKKAMEQQKEKLLQQHKQIQEQKLQQHILNQQNYLNIKPKKYIYMDRYRTTCNLMEKGIYNPEAQVVANTPSKTVPQLNLIEFNGNESKHKLFEHPIFIN